jgi:uncharacterized membrane protein (UPF0127 family)
VSARAAIVTTSFWLASCACEGRTFSIESASGGLVRGCARVASTADDRVRGLIGRAPLVEGEALWLEWPTSVEACVHNAGVSFAIDAVFVDERGAVLAIERAISADDPSVRCHGNARHVIELRADGARDVRVPALVRW